MERKNHYALIFIFLIAFVLDGFSVDYKNRIYRAFISNNMKDWKTVIDEIEKQTGSNQSLLTELVNYQYGYIGYCIGADRHSEAENYLRQAEKNLQKLEKTGADPSVINSYKSAFYGFSIGLNLIKAPFLGPKSVKHSKLAMEQNPENPLGYIQFGNSQLHMPAVFGGSKKAAVDYFQKAEKIMEKNRESLKNDWNYLSLLTSIGQAFELQSDYGNAKKYYEKLLQTEPDYLWVKNELYLQLIQKMKTENE